VDVLFDPSAKVNVKVGDRVQGGASVLAYLAPKANWRLPKFFVRRKVALMKSIFQAARA